MNDHNIVLTEPNGFPEDALEQLRGLGQVTLGPFDHNQLKKEIAKASVLFVRLSHRIDSEFLNPAQNLRYVMSATTGLDHIDTSLCRKRGIKIISLKGEREFLETIPATAELTLALLLSVLRSIPAAHKDAVAGIWNRDAYPGGLMFGLKLGLIGLGRLGEMVGKMATSLNMEVRGHDPHVMRSSIKQMPLYDLLGWADAISIHSTYDPTTRRMIGESEFAAMKKGSLLINTARGGIIDEIHLINALKSGHLAGAGLDVLDGETDILNGVQHPLMTLAQTHPRLVLTPHIGGMVPSCRRSAERFVTARLVTAMGEQSREWYNDPP